MKKPITNQTIACLGALLLSSAIGAQAQISLINSDSALTPGDTSPASLSGAFAMGSGANALVVSVPFRSALAAGSANVTFAGQTADYSLVKLINDRAGVATFLFLNPAITSGNIDVDFTVGGASGARGGFAAYALSDVYGVYDSDSYALNGNGDTTTSLSYDGLTGGYSIATLAGEGPGTATPGITGGNIDVTPLNWNSSATRFATLWSVGGQIPTDGTFNNGFTAYRALAESVVSLQAVPEPTSLALLVGGLGMLMVRRVRRA